MRDLEKLLKKNLHQHCARSASTYTKFAVVEREIADRLLARLTLMKLKPQRILDCGARTGYSSELLRAKYPQAFVVGCDFSAALLAQTRKKIWQRPKPVVCADYAKLAFQPRRFDLIFANLALAWVSDLSQVLRQFYDLLTPEGLLLFTTLGPDTLQELRSVQGERKRVHDFIDMHDLGDQLLARKFLDPVMDMEYLTLQYVNATGLMQDLKLTGASNASAHQARGLQGRGAWQIMLEQYQQQFSVASDQVRATVEIVYGHAWMPAEPDLMEMEAGEVAIPLSSLRRNR